MLKIFKVLFVITRRKTHGNLEAHIECQGRKNISSQGEIDFTGKDYGDSLSKLAQQNKIHTSMTDSVSNIIFCKDTGGHYHQIFSDIIDFQPDATVVIDVDNKIIAWNRAMEEMTGVKKEDIIGQESHAGTVPFYGEKRPYLLDLIGISDEELQSKYQYVQRKGKTLFTEVFAPALYDGKGAYVWVTGAPLFDIHGNRIGAIESIRDITDRKTARRET